MNKGEKVEVKKSSRRRLTVAIDRVFGDLQDLESPSPKEVNKRMLTTFRELRTMREKIRKQDLNAENFKANQKYQQAKDKIKTYIDMNYNKESVKDSKRITEILQNRPLTTYYKPSQKLLFESMEQLGDVLKNNKRKFGEFWELTPKMSLSAKLPEISQTEKKRKNTPKNAKLSKLITKLMVKNLGLQEQSEPASPKGIKKSEKSEPASPKTGFEVKKVRLSLNNVMSLFEGGKDEIVFNDEEYFAPEYMKYISDVDNSLKVQKYIGQNSEKRRKIGQMQAKCLRGN